MIAYSVKNENTCSVLWVKKYRGGSDMELVPVRCRVPQLLIKIGKDQRWLANESGKAESKISDYCAMRSIMNLRTAALLARILKCKIDDIYVWEWQKK